LQAGLDTGLDLTYYPIDISANVLEICKAEMQKEIDAVPIKPIAGQYFEALAKLPDRDVPRLVLFLGSTVGNFLYEGAVKFFQQLAGLLHSGDALLTGFDLRKDPATILRAYNDSQGITAQFNLNLLRRINTELGGNFALDQWRHYPVYDPITGAARSYLVSQKAQDVYIDAFEESFHFDQWELIYTEISQKYSLAEIADFAKKAGLQEVENFFDCRHFFTDALWKKA
jgi:uncharacterized SAM-dependent methyltransferase